MFFSKLTHIIERYDRYGIHRLNGFKVVYILLILFLFNALFDIQNAYFYFFYIPITAMAAEVMGERVEQKYTFFIVAVIGTSFMVFLFNLFTPYPLFFLFFAFISSLSIYAFALRHSMLAIVPIILSLATYSLIYPSANTDFYSILNNMLTTLIALGVILGALLLFPLSYYYRLWLRAFQLLIDQILDNVLLLQEHKPLHWDAIQGHTRQMVLFAHLLPKQLPTYSILKINLLINQLHLISCVPVNEWLALDPRELRLFIHNLRLLRIAIPQEKPCQLLFTNNSFFSKLIHSWNYLCSN